MKAENSGKLQDKLSSQCVEQHVSLLCSEPGQALLASVCFGERCPDLLREEAALEQGHSLRRHGKHLFARCRKVRSGRGAKRPVKPFARLKQRNYARKYGSSLNLWIPLLSPQGTLN